MGASATVCLNRETEPETGECGTCVSSVPSSVPSNPLFLPPGITRKSAEDGARFVPSSSSTSSSVPSNPFVLPPAMTSHSSVNRPQLNTKRDSLGLYLTSGTCNKSRFVSEGAFVWLALVTVGVAWRSDLWYLGVFLWIISFVVLFPVQNILQYRSRRRSGTCDKKDCDGDSTPSTSDTTSPNTSESSDEMCNCLRELDEGSDKAACIPRNLPENTLNLGEKIEDLRRACAHIDACYLDDQDGNGKFNDICLLRFLLARGGDIPKTVKMLTDYAKWRAEHFPEGSPLQNWWCEISGRNKGLIAVDFVDNAGRPIVIVRGKYRKKNRPVMATRGLCVGMIDGTRAVARRLQDQYKDASGEPLNPLCQYSCILDLGDFGYSNADLDGLLEVTSLLFHYYPESIDKIYIIHSNFIFSTMWSVIQVFLEKRNLQKYVFLEKEKYRDFFPTFIPPESLHRRYGGIAEDPPIEMFGRYRPLGAPEKFE